MGPKFQKHCEERQCQEDYQAQIHLAKARVAAESFDIACACVEFEAACELAKSVCNWDLHAELQNIAALIHLAKDEPYLAAKHLDQEASFLNRAGNYREIPVALEHAAAAYESGARFGEASDRMLRVARIWYGRGEPETSWKKAQEAIRLNEFAGDDEQTIRIALLVNELRESLSRTDSITDLPLSDDEMVVMTNPSVTLARFAGEDGDDSYGIDRIDPEASDGPRLPLD